MNTIAKPWVDDYLLRLSQAARALPRGQAEELIDEITAHINSALPAGAGEADVRNVLDALGSPEEIVASAAPEAPASRAERRGLREIAALILLVTGFPFVIGWLAGLALLLWSPLWTGRQKLLGALVFPGGLMGPLVLLPAVVWLRAPVDIPLSPVARFVLAVAAQLAVAVYLYRSAGRQTTTLHLLT